MKEVYRSFGGVTTLSGIALVCSKLKIRKLLGRQM
jgi:ABC-type sugar transport system ATPase subunit